MIKQLCLSLSAMPSVAPVKMVPPLPAFPSLLAPFTSCLNLHVAYVPAGAQQAPFMMLKVYVPILSLR